MVASGISGLTEKIDFITNIIIIAVIAIAIIAAIVMILFYRRYKMRRSEKLSEQSVDYSSLKRLDSKDYVKFEDIKNDMIISENGTLFTAVIVVSRGVDFYSAHVSERVVTQKGYRAFVHTIDKPITYRQYGTEVNLSDTESRYTQALKDVEEKLFFLNDDFMKTKGTMDEMEREMGDSAIKSIEYQQIVDALDKLRAQMETLKWRRIHLRDQISYIEQLQDAEVEQTPHETYIVDWKYYPGDYPVDLSEEEVLERAAKELLTMTRTKIHALSQAGVKARRCKTAELIDMYYRHFHPITGGKTKLEGSAFFDDIITTTEKDALEDEQRETMAFEAMNAMAEVLGELDGGSTLNNIASDGGGAL